MLQLVFFFLYDFFSQKKKKNGKSAASESIFTRKRMIEYKVTFLSEEMRAYVQYATLVSIDTEKIFW